MVYDVEASKGNSIESRNLVFSMQFGNRYQSCVAGMDVAQNIRIIYSRLVVIYIKLIVSSSI